MHIFGFLSLKIGWVCLHIANRVEVRELISD